MAGNSHNKYCRQTLLGGNYELLHKTTLLPNPDYYTAYFWNKLIGTSILETSTSPKIEELRIYAACGRTPGDLIIIFINLSETDDFTLHLEFDEIQAEAMRYAYILTSDGLESQKTFVNGVEVKGVDENGDLIGLQTDGQDALTDMKIPARSYGYFQYQGSNVLVCNMQVE